MDRTLFGDLECLDALLLREVSLQGDLALDAIEHALSGFTFGAVFRVDPRMAQAHRHARERPPFPSRIQRDGPGWSGAEPRQVQYPTRRSSRGSPTADTVSAARSCATRMAPAALVALSWHPRSSPTSSKRTRSPRRGRPSGCATEIRSGARGSIRLARLGR